MQAFNFETHNRALFHLVKEMSVDQQGLTGRNAGFYLLINQFVSELVIKIYRYIPAFYLKKGSNRFEFSL